MLLFVILAGAFGIGTVLAYERSNTAIPAILCIMGMIFSIFFASVCGYNNCSKARIETLNKTGYEAISKERIYEMSQKELDNCYRIVTLKGTYYFDLNDKD